MPHDVFISHSVKDKEVADAICETLEAAGIPCWIAPRDVPPGGNYAAEITRGIRQTRVVVFVFSEPANQSSAVQKELERAFNASKRIIPFRIQNVPASDAVDFLIAASQWIDATSGRLEDHLEELVHSLREIFKTEPASEGEIPKSTSKLTPPRKPSKRWFTPMRLALAVGLLLVGALVYGGTRMYRSGQTAISVRLESPAANSLIIGNDADSRLLLRYSLPEKLNRKAEIELQSHDGAVKKITTSGSSHLVSDLEGPIRWRVRASWGGGSNGVEFGPWSEWRSVTYYNSRLSKILRTKRCVIGTADLSPDDQMVNFDPATNRPGGYEVELLARFLKAEAVERNLGESVEIDYKPAEGGWGKGFFVMLSQDPDVDILVSGVTPTEAREREWGVKFSAPSITFCGALLVRNGEVGLKDGQLTPKVIGVAANTTNEDFLIKMFGPGHPRVYVDPGPKAYDSLVQRLRSESIDAIFIDEVYLPTLLKQHPGLEAETDVVRLDPKENPVFEQSSAAYVLRPQDGELHRRLNRFLEREIDAKQELRQRFLGMP